MIDLGLPSRPAPGSAAAYKCRVSCDTPRQPLHDLRPIVPVHQIATWLAGRRKVLCGGRRRWRLRWPRGRRLRRGWIRSSRTRTEVALEDKAHDRLFGERHSRRQSSRARRYHRGWRMAGAPAQEEIDEPTGKFLRPRSDIAHLQLLA